MLHPEETLLPECGARWTTFERVQLRELRSSKHREKEPFEREKLTRSLKIALQKRPVEEEQIDRICNSIQRRLESLGKTRCPLRSLGRS